MKTRKHMMPRSLTAIIVMLVACSSGDESPTREASARSELKPWWNGIEDTITSSGWKIEYLVKSDSSDPEDLYMRWSKGDFVRMYCDSGVLNNALTQIPEYLGESDSLLMFDHACSSTHGAITGFSKTSSSVVKYCGVVGCDAETGRILWVPLEATGTSPFHTMLSYADSGTDTVLNFKGTALALIPITIFDSIRFDDRSVHLVAELVIHGENGSKDVKESLVARTR